MLPKKLMCTVPFCLIGLLAIILLTTAAGLEVEEKEIKPTTPTTLMIPSVEEVRANGYPVNEQGQTYGPDIRENTNIEEAPDLILVCNENGEIYGSEYFLNQIGVEPDLILTCGENGVEGFVRAEDLNYDPVETLQDVITYQETRAIKRSIPLYAADGETVIGSFTVDNSNVCANSF